MADAAGTTGRSLSQAMMLAAAFAVGIALGWLVGVPIVWPWLVLAIVLLSCGLVSRVRSRFGLFGCTIAATIPFGASWLTIQTLRVPANELAAMLGEQSAIVRMQGIATSSPILRETSSGSMALFGIQPPATYFRVRAQSLLDRFGIAHPVSGTVLVKCEQSLPSFRPGDRVTLVGTLGRFPPAMNPGEFDRAEYARMLGQSGMLRVASRDLVLLESARSGRFVDWFADLRERLRRNASAWVLADLPPDSHHEREALIASLLLGERDPELDNLNDAFRRTGLAHVLAISGMHLNVVAGLVLALLRLTGRSARWHGLIVIAVIGLYLLMIEARMPVLRAGFMTGAMCLGLVVGRRVRIGSLVAASAIVLLLWNPSQLFDTGFQLSYGVVMALITLSPRLRQRWFGPRDQFAASTSAMLGEWLKDSAAAAVVAWAVATPLVAYHFDMVSPLAAPASLLVLPVVAGLLAAGYAKMAVGAILPSAGMFLAPALMVPTDLLASIVQAVDALPMSFVGVPHPSSVWTIVATAVVVAWIVHESRRQRRWLQAGSVVMLLWLLWPALPLRETPALRLDTLAVGDGSCHLVRAGGRSLLFDAGSSTDLDAGRAEIVPALRRLGLRRVDAVAVSHANLDHFSAVLEVVDEFAVREVLVTRQFLAAARRDPLSPPGYFISALEERMVPLTIAGASTTRTDRGVHWTWFHPRDDDEFGLVNDTSMVIRVDAAGRRLLLTGDIQRAGIIRLLERHGADVDADVLELPHHGSYHDAAVAFVEAVSPSVVVQSTGFTRFAGDRWTPHLFGISRLVTARDGACWVEIDHAGDLRFGSSR